MFTLAESLGGIESLIEHPGRMTHASVAGTELEVPADLVRLSVGIETVDDLLADLDQALGVSIGEPARGLRRLRLDVHQGLLVDLATGAVVAGAEHRTTIDTDVLDGYDVCLAELARADPRAADAEVLACSSAGGGLRVAVVGNEELVTAEAGRRVALSSGGKVVTVRAVASGRTTSTSPRTRPTSCCSPAAPTAATTSRSCARPGG